VTPSPKTPRKIPETRSVPILSRVLHVLIYGGIIAALITILATWLLSRHRDQPILHCDVYSPIHDPDGSGNQIQIVEIRNLGRQSANNLEIRLGIPQSDSMDFYVDSLRKPDSVNRDNSSLYVSVDALPPGGFVCITIRLLGAPLSASAISVSSREGTMSQKDIRFLSWEDDQ
jgi:hypothetical protein